MRAIRLTWRGGEHSVTLFGTESKRHTCGIMQETTSDITLLGLGSWELHDTRINTVTLPCKHTFHPTALAQHFAYRDMRCPVCRQGSTAKLAIERSDVPSEVASALLQHVTQMQAEDKTDEEADELVELVELVDADAVRQLLTIYAETFIVGQHFTSMFSRLLPQPLELDTPPPTPPSAPPPPGDAATAPAPAPALCEPFALYRSFQRLFFTNLNRFAHSQDSHVRFCITHPLLCYPIVSEAIPMHTLQSSPSTNTLTSTPSGRAVLARVHTDGAQSTMRVEVDVTAVSRLCMHAISAQVHFLQSVFVP